VGYNLQIWPPISPPFVTTITPLIDPPPPKVIPPVDTRGKTTYGEIRRPEISKRRNQPKAKGEPRNRENQKDKISQKEIDLLWYGYLSSTYTFLTIYRTFPKSERTAFHKLNGSQYKLLIRIKDEDKRAFYIAESIKNSWSGRELERQINSSLFERLLLSSNKKDVWL